MDGDVLARLNVEAVELAVRPRYHQVDVQRDARELAELCAEVRAERVVGDKFAVHNVNMQRVDAALFKDSQGLLRVRKVDAHQRRRELGHIHGSYLIFRVFALYITHFAAERQRLSGEWRSNWEKCAQVAAKTSTNEHKTAKFQRTLSRLLIDQPVTQQLNIEGVGRLAIGDDIVQLADIKGVEKEFAVEFGAVAK